MTQEIRLAFQRTIFWSAAWVAVLLIAASIDWIVVVTLLNSTFDTTSSICPAPSDGAAIELSASSIAYGYIGSVGAEAAIRGNDERRRYAGKKGLGIGTSKILISLLITTIIILISAITEIIGPVNNWKVLAFTGVDLYSVVTDGKLIVIFVACSALRVYIYHGGQVNSPSTN